VSAGQTANGNGPTFDINDPSGWELALVTNPTDSATAAANHNKLVSTVVFSAQPKTHFNIKAVLHCKEFSQMT